MGERFRFLHLTDLHLRAQPDDPKVENLLNAFAKDVERLSRRDGPFDAVFFTGDIAYSGRTEEYEAFDVLRGRALSKLAPPGMEPLFLPIPGNHDVLWPAVRVLRALPSYWRDDPSFCEDFFREERSPWRIELAEVFGPYLKWRGQPTHATLKHFHDGWIPGDFTASVTVGELQIAVVGLNSSFLQVDKRPYLEKLAISAHQFRCACSVLPSDWIDSHDFAILMTHHPPSWLLPEARIDYSHEIALPGRFAVHLVGHLHDEVPREESVAQSQPNRQWQGSSLFGLEPLHSSDGKKLERRHGYAACELRYENGVARLLRWPRKLFAGKGGGRHFGPDYEVGPLEDEHIPESTWASPQKRQARATASSSTTAGNRVVLLAKTWERSLDALRTAIEARSPARTIPRLIFENASWYYVVEGDATSRVTNEFSVRAAPGVDQLFEIQYRIAAEEVADAVGFLDEIDFKVRRHLPDGSSQPVPYSQFLDRPHEKKVLLHLLPPLRPSDPDSCRVEVSYRWPRWFARALSPDGEALFFELYSVSNYGVRITLDAPTALGLRVEADAISKLSTNWESHSGRDRWEASLVAEVSASLRLRVFQERRSSVENAGAATHDGGNSTPHA